MNLIVKERTLFIDASKCPICGEFNLCAMEIAKATGKPQEPCWCVSAKFTSEVLCRVPDESKYRSCICKKCATKQ